MEREKKVLDFILIGPEERGASQEMLTEYLEAINKLEMMASLNYILDEMTGNAFKANLKRVYFNKSGLDIRNPEEYQKGMENFQAEVQGKSDDYFSLIQDSQYRVNIEMEIKEGLFTTSIINNAPLLPEEKVRIRDKFSKARRFKNLDEVSSNILDTTEGAGFGIVLMLMMLRKVGLDEKIIRFFSDATKTRVQIQVPVNLLGSQEKEVIADAILKEIESIPQFPQHIMQLSQILNSQDSGFADISGIINKDPALITDLLKTANSAIYALPQKMSRVEDVVKLIGFRGVKNLILGYSINNILMSKYKLKEIEGIMEHSAEVAFYSYRLAEKVKLRRLYEDLYIGAILHDIGKILVYAMKPEVMDDIEKICSVHGVRREMIDSLTDGYNHAIIGSKLAEKWNFPDYLTQVIQYHHIPLEADDEFMDLVGIIYLSDILYYYKRGKYPFSEINRGVLERYGLEEKENWDDFAQQAYLELEASEDKG